MQLHMLLFLSYCGTLLWVLSMVQNPLLAWYVEQHPDDGVQGFKYIFSYQPDPIRAYVAHIEEIWLPEHGLIINIRRDRGSHSDNKGMNVFRDDGPRNDNKSMTPVKIPSDFVLSALNYLTAKDKMMSQRPKLGRLFKHFEEKQA